MSNKELSELLNLFAKLIELHNLNPFKAKAFANAAFKINKYPKEILSLPENEILNIEGIGKGILEAIQEIKLHHTFSELQHLVNITPPGLFEILKIKGLGPKKVGVIWKELGVESIGELVYACNENRLITLKGFGEKSQNEILEKIKFLLSVQRKYLFASIKKIAEEFVTHLKTKHQIQLVSSVGELRRMCNVIEKAEFLIGTEKFNEFKNEEPPFDIDFKLHFCKPEEFEYHLLKLTAHPKHLAHINTKHCELLSEKEIYAKNRLEYMIPPMREGETEFEWQKKYFVSEIVETQHLKGILHNHTTYSDGIHTIKEMANRCKELGYHYIGISDHSQTAVYANGLKPDAILKQLKEIEELNNQLSPFKIFKGIESDILPNGQLDYPTEILSLFDFIIASVHSALKMDETKATERLIKAIENPFTTILGHPSGRLLLSREGYPLHYKKIIEACAANHVIIELNANPYRLDIDWKWIYYAMEKEVLISINPDAHHIGGLEDVQYGIYSAQKGGLTKKFTFNTKSAKEVELFFLQKKAKTLSDKI
ncbi:MAG: PHP domain-containing protein [Bacteroidetes bacterium]|nr:DNA polymerase/3'-5' exonuclease PolX [Bacteroidota bacterium]MBV6460291.1 DNA polymerase/3'-5' exonuclease PolX [Flavobacteriales bacterium]WKZ74659.1 MAG: PHP domain-containing protein [Vicingaceae bacterium]MCL4815843.1 PHP domain-containing protein [Flavobacteriales bacterium]NOG94966.1 PHP domain-containing protein [Bacteroidota bacterium]